MKKFKLEYLIYLFLILSPIMDAGSFLIREKTSIFNFFMIIRIIIPIILLLDIFIKNKKKRLHIIIWESLYVIYSIIHLYIFKNELYGISYGSLVEEARYLFNYALNINMLFIIMYYYKNKNMNFRKYMYMCLGVFLFIIYFSIFTKTSYPTYIDGIGYKSYFVSGNSLATTLLLLLSYVVSDFKNKKIYSYILFIITFIYLCFLLGSRTGLLGPILILLVYFISILIKKFSVKKVIIACSIFFLSGVSLFVFGGKAFQRRENVKADGEEIVDVITGSSSHVTGDTSKIVLNIRNDVYTLDYISDDMKSAYLDFYEYANKHKISPSDLRSQQLIYNTYKVINQKNILYILFGNGYLNNYPEMTLEMEIPALLLNFGIVGIFLFLGPFVYLIIKNIKKISTKNVMYLFAVCLAFGLSFFASYVMFSTTCMFILSILLNMYIKGEEK